MRTRCGTLGNLGLALLLATGLLLGTSPAALGADSKSADKTKGGPSRSTKGLVDASKKSAGSRTPPPAVAAKPGKTLEVTEKSFRSMEKDGSLSPTSTARNVEGAVESTALGEAMGSLLVKQLGKNRKRIEKFTAEPTVDGKRFRTTDGGNYVTELKTKDGRTETVVLLGSGFATRDLSETLTEVGNKTTARNNYTAVYQGLREALADDPKSLGVILKGMPEPGKIGKKDPWKLLRDIAKRWNKNPPTKIKPVRGKRDCGSNCEKDVPPRLLVGGKDAISCYDRSPTGLWAGADWTLKGKSTCVKDQGETRGTGVAFAISAAVETSVRREHDRCVDLSEQHLHYQQKNHWFPIPPNFGDDLNSPNSVLGMMVGDYEFRTEDQWNYNLSPQRTEVTFETKEQGVYKGYKDSCSGYSDSPCSDTNHQGQLLCVKGSKRCGYTAQIPPPEDPIKVLSYDSFFNVNLAGPTVDMAPVFLGLGLPVVASFQVTQSFLDAADDGYVRPGSGQGNTGRQRREVASDPLRGWHVAMIEGYVRNQDVPKGTPKAAGGGYFVMKNSWGPCVGDGGYWYVPKEWMEEHALSMTALTGFEAYGQSSVMGVAFNMALPPEAPVFLPPYDNQAFVAGYSSLPWSDDNPTSTAYHICLVSDATQNACSQEAGTLFHVPSNEAAQKHYRLPRSIVYSDAYRGKTVTWMVVACNAVGCTWSDGAQTARFALPNARLYLPTPGTATSRTPVVYWYGVEGATSYKVVFGPSPLPAPYPASEDSEFKKYSTPGVDAGNGTFSFTVPSNDPIPTGLGSTVHWYVEACRNIGNNNICSLWPYAENMPTQPHEGVFYFGSLNLGEADMTFDEACGIIRDLVDSPRCRNCHAAIPDVTRTDAMTPHPGLSAGTVCAGCHNGAATSDVPWPGEGEPLWHAPTDPGMHWTDLTPDQIVDRIANPATNGGRSLDDIANHVQTDHLVIWGFDPVGGDGELHGRTPAPHGSTYVTAFTTWADQWEANGSSCD